MSLLVQPRLVNGPSGDPGVYLDFRFGRRAMLFDLGDLGPLSPRELLRVSHAFVSHAHMDHVAGFDRLLRLRLHRPRPLTVVGPPGFVDQVAHRLGAFSWNLLDATSVDFRLTALEFDGTRASAAAEFRAREAFARRALPPPALPAGLVLEEEALTVEAVALDHGIPSLAFALQEALRINVWRSALDEMGLPVGPWIDEAKRAVRADLPDVHTISVPGHGEVPLSLLRARVLRIGRGQRAAYVTDAADTPANRDRIAGLAADADHLFVEAPFLARDGDVAAATAHLTARAAGEIAHAAGARRVVGFHHSARYADDTTPLEAELHAAASGDRAAPPAPPGPPAHDPGWLEAWKSRPLDPDAAVARFDHLPGLAPADLHGTWRGVGLATGHPLDGLLETLGWFGKRFETDDRVQPLLFGPGATPIDPALLPVGVVVRWPGLARTPPVPSLFSLLRPVVRARRPAARLRRVTFRGVASAAMIYDRQPIIDHFRAVDGDLVLGLMEMRAAPPYFFLLSRAD